MNDYQRVTEALEKGASPAMLCMTCPWDRLCVQPPQMTSSEVKAQLEKSLKQDEAKKRDDGFPVQSLLTMMTLGSRDTAGELCPVFALRIRNPEGRHIADSIRATMQKLNESDFQ